MKEIDDFFSAHSSCEKTKKTSPSKIYPILKNLEEHNLIEGRWGMHNNKNIKYYSITKEGLELIDYIKDFWISWFSNPKWSIFLSDMFGLDLKVEVNNDKHN